jgi:hypothetical protein
MLRQEDCQFEDSLGYITRLYLKKFFFKNFWRNEKAYLQIHMELQEAQIILKEKRTKLEDSHFPT